MTTDKQISAAILQLRMRSPFFATLALFARIYITRTVSTAATDGRDVFINEEFWQKLTKTERLGLMLHEVLHAALLHVPRRGTRDPILWNIAADIVINGMILAEKDISLPQGHLRDKNLEHLSVEEVYHHLQAHPDHKYHLTLHDLMYGDLKDKDGLAQHWRNAMQHAHTVSRMSQGTIPAGLQRELTALDPAQLDWRSYLWRFLVRTPTDFQGFDRRFIGNRLYLETMEGESVRVYVAVDTSGSIGTKDMRHFLSEVVGILQAYPHIKATLYYVDAECYGPYELTADQAIPSPVGGGGTDFRPFFTKVAEEHDTNETGVCVYLTDGYGTFPEQEFVLPVLWVLSPGGIAVQDVPFGEAVRLIQD